MCLAIPGKVERIEIKDGVREGERVVIENPERLKDGELVRYGE